MALTSPEPRKKRKFWYWPRPQKPGMKRGPNPKQMLPWIERMPDSIRPHKHGLDIILYLGATRCFGAGTELLMHDRSVKAVQDVAVGDLLMSPDGTSRKVVELVKGEGTLYRISPHDGGKPFICNGDHLLSLRQDPLTCDKNSPPVAISLLDWMEQSDYFKENWQLWRSVPPAPGEKPYLPISLVPGFEVETLPPGEFFGFALSGPDQLFLSPDYTVFHNSGKSVGAVARALYLARKYDGARIIVGSINFSHLEETIMEDYKRLLSKRKDWDHPSILRRPNRTHKRIVFKNGSIVSFKNLENWNRTAGMECDFLHIEEPELLKNEDALEYLMTRMSGNAIPFKQIILTANPNENLDWMIKWFKLHQFDINYKGPPVPIGEPCRCHLCVKCEKKGQEVLCIDGACPICGYEKEDDCPGDQHFIRVVHITADDNDHLRDGYQRDLNATLSYDKRVQLVQGLVLHRTKGKCYPSYDIYSVWEENVPIDRNKDIIWALDFNQYPQCSVICQEFVEDNVRHVAVIDEIVKYAAGPEKVARAFIEKYKDIGLTGQVVIFGDPAGFTRLVLPTDDVTDRYQILVKMLEEEGFDVVLRARPTVYPILKRIDSVNWMMKDGNEYRRMRFNPQCLNTILSAEQTKWNSQGKKEDETEDIKARKKGRDGEVWQLTHLMCALGYYIVEEHPMIVSDAGAPYSQDVATGRVTEIINGQVVARQISNEEMQADIDDELDEEELEEELEDENRSFASEFRSRGLWGQ